MIKLSIHVEAGSKKWQRAFPRLKEKMEAAAACAFLHAKKPMAFNRRAFDINILLTDDKNIQTLNKAYRGKNKPTNVLSFPQINFHHFKKAALDIFPAKSVIPLGDVVLAFETLRRESVQQSKALEAHALHMVVHGVLHLLGYDHERLKDAKNMEKLECDILAVLGYSDPYDEITSQKHSR